MIFVGLPFYHKIASLDTYSACHGIANGLVVNLLENDCHLIFTQANKKETTTDNCI